MRKPRILVVGSLVMDLIVSTSRFPAKGETVIGLDYTTATGGKGANQAVQAARLGAEVTMVGCVGDDDFGRALVQSARNAGVDVSHIRVTKDACSAIGNVQIERAETGTNNRIIVVPGANQCIRPEDVAFLKEGIAGYDMVILQFEIPMAINELVASIPAGVKKIFALCIGNSEYFHSLQEKLKKKFENIVVRVGEICPVLGTHVGPGTVGVACAL